MLQNLEFILGSTGVLNSIALDKGKSILSKMLQSDKESNPEVDKLLLDMVYSITSKNPKIKSKDILRVLQVCSRNQDSVSVLTSANTFLNNAYSKKGAIETLHQKVSVYDLVDAYGVMNMDLSIFNGLDIVVDKVAHKEDIFLAMSNIALNKDVCTSYWILSHLIDYPEIGDIIEGDSFQVIQKSLAKYISSEQEFSEHYDHTTGFLYYLHGVFPEVAEKIIEDNSGFWGRLIFEMKNLEGNKRELGLLVIELFLEKYESRFVDLDVIGNIKEWVNGARNAEELLCYTRFLKACSRSELLHASLLEEKVEFALLEKVERDYPNDVENFKAMLECYNANLVSEGELSQFICCQDGMKRTLL
jgi:hypothetical protein